MEPNIIEQPKSLSPALRHGCLSVREFYWAINDLYDSLYQDSTKPRIVGQLIWREFFYTMSVNNLKYGQMEGNPVCLQIQWEEDERLYKVSVLTQFTVTFTVIVFECYILNEKFATIFSTLK